MKSRMHGPIHASRLLFSYILILFLFLYVDSFSGLTVALYLNIYCTLRSFVQIDPKLDYVWVCDKMYLSLHVQLWDLALFKYFIHSLYT